MVADFQSTALGELVDICPDPLIGVDLRGYITLFNRAAETLLGYRASDVIGTCHITTLYARSEDAREVGSRLADPATRGQLQGHETELLSANGTVMPIRLSAALVERDGEVLGSVGFFHDLTERHRLERELARLSITDELSGLFNQRHFHNQLVLEVERANRYRRPLSLIYLDLDGFKQINDLHGHQQGDRVISFTAQVLRGRLRQSDQAFRYGGDEFTVLLAETGSREAVRLAQQLRLGYEAEWPFDWRAQDGGSQRIAMSIGVAELQPGEEGVSLLKRADLAMYEAKREGGDRIVQAPGAGAHSRNRSVNGR